MHANAQIARQAAVAEGKAGELKVALEKAGEERAVAVKDREQAYESLSRTAVSLQEHKVRGLAA